MAAIGIGMFDSLAPVRFGLHFKFVSFQNNVEISELRFSYESLGIKPLFEAPSYYLKQCL